MRIPVWLPVLVSCAAKSASPVAPVSVSSPPAVCPECPPQGECPLPVESEEPAPCPPPQPVTGNWYCMELERVGKKRGQETSYCFALVRVCEDFRHQALNKPKKWRPVPPCSPRPTAFCFHRTNPASMSRQTVCAVSIEDCENHRGVHSQIGITKTTYLSPCEPAPNTDTFSYDAAGNDVPP